MERGPYKRKLLVYGFGINDADYVTQKYDIVEGKRRRVWVCPYYEDWRQMLKRCYSTPYQKDRPMYVGCSVCEEWRYFSNFIKWVDQQPNRDWQNCDLDKDILVNGNRVYSSETCVYVTKQINILFRECKERDLPMGVYRKNGKFSACCQDVFTGKLEHLGSFANIEDAENCFLSHRSSMLIRLAGEQQDLRVSAAILKRLSGKRDGRRSSLC